jgi:hypothetical protein
MVIRMILRARRRFANDPAHHVFEIVGLDRIQRLDDGRQHLLAFALGQRRNDRLLVGKILVESADRKPGAFRDAIGVEPFLALALQNLSRRFEDRVDSMFCPSLSG